MDVEIIAPSGVLFAGKAKAVVMPGLDGSLGILENHAPLITALKAGFVKVTDEGGNETTYQVKRGTAEVLRNKVLIVAEA